MGDIELMIPLLTWFDLISPRSKVEDILWSHCWKRTTVCRSRVTSINFSSICDIPRPPLLLGQYLVYFHTSPYLLVLLNSVSRVGALVVRRKYYKERRPCGPRVNLNHTSVAMRSLNK
ncbi:hypothetical protein B0H12DRAFT_308752 [Mycena haematopus]|nr:hypothetical protein B0H12DRAFT_308752 [Mycena haematopus]